MKKVIIVVIVFIAVIAIGIGVWVYIDAEETKRLDAESVTLKDDLTIEFGKEAKVSDFISSINGNMVEDHKIDTEKLGDITVSFEYINIKNKKRPYEFTIKTLDKNAPKIFSGNSYTVTVGYKKDLTNVLLSGDDIDDNPTRKIVGEYDFNTVGDYPLTYVVTDSSGNETKQNFTLHVIEKSTSSEPPAEKEKFPIADIITNYKTAKTKIGIDVSKWQGEIDWQKVKNAGVEFAMIRMGYQTDYDGDCVVDPYFIQNIEGAKAVRTTCWSVFLFIFKKCRPSNRPS